MARTRRRPYTGSKRFDRSCRCHGGCGWCLDNRMHATRRRLASALDIERDAIDNCKAQSNTVSSSLQDGALAPRP